MNEKQTLDFSTIIASALHDIKNSLAIVINTVDELATEETEKNSRIELIQAEGQRLNSDLIQLLALYRLEKKQLFTNIENNNIAEFFEDIFLDNQAMLQHNSLTLNIKCDPELDAYFDRHLIEGVLNSCLNNNFRYAKKMITLESKKINKALIIQISDDGPGYPTEILEQPKQETINFKNKQTGLGLYFAQAVAQLHHNKGQHGHIELSNSSTGGSIFSIHLP